MMNNEELRRSWATTLRHLAASRYYLPLELDDKAALAAKNLDHFLRHNELELALDEAEALGQLCEASAAFWDELRLAAENMGLVEAARRFSHHHDAAV